MEHSELLIFGYVRRVETLLHNNQIPSEIYKEIVKKVDDHYMMHRGSYQWILSDKSIIRNLSQGRLLSTMSSEFVMCKLRWRIILRLIDPMSDFNSQKCVGVYVKALKIPDTIKYALIRLTIICKQANGVFHGIKRYGGKQTS